MSSARGADMAPTVIARRGDLFVGGAWVSSTGAARIAVENPATEAVIDEVADGTEADVDRAVGAARAAFPAWSATRVRDRVRVLEVLRDGLAARQAELATTITAEMGCPIRVSETVQTGLPVQVVASCIELADAVDSPETIGNSLVMREPTGVVAAITPWNYPLHQSIAKIAPALLAGCTVVHKPSELAPLTAYAIAEILAEAGLPDGVYNLVSGRGEVVGEALARHPDVDMVSFTGSTRAGRRVAALAAETVKHVALELGGKSANVILDDADLTAAVKVGVANCMLNAGQTCTAWTRMLAPASRYDEIVERAVEAAASYAPGDPTDRATRLGPLASRAQKDRVVGYVDAGRRAGARAVRGGDDVELPACGHYLAPVVFADVAPTMTIAQEEIFGPVLSIIKYNTDEDAVRIANATPYGLAGAVWSGDTDRALSVARRLRAGQVDINGARFNPRAPFGGYGQSGHGRELGRFGIEEFQQLKAVQLP